QTDRPRGYGAARAAGARRVTGAEAAAAPSAPSRRERFEILLLLGSLSTMGAASTDLYVPALPAIARDLHVTQSATQLTITTFFLGLAVGQVATGSISDVLGRR